MIASGCNICLMQRARPLGSPKAEPAPISTADRMLVLSLVKAIEIVGEAASQVSSATREQLPEIRWVDIVAMRNRLVHAYFDINLEILWQTVQHDLPPLIVTLERVLS